MADLKTLLGDAYQEDMTLEQINEVLSEKDFVDKGILSEYVPKSTADKYATEAADFKKKWKATQTEAEQAAQAESERQLHIEEELKALRRTTKVSEFEKNYLKLGYDADTASKIAEATHDGDMDTVFNLQGKFLENKQKAIKADILKDMPGAISGNQSTVDYSKQIAEAQSSGNMALTASLIRQQAEANARKE